MQNVVGRMYKRVGRRAPHHSSEEETPVGDRTMASSVAKIHVKIRPIAFLAPLKVLYSATRLGECSAAYECILWVSKSH